MLTTNSIYIHIPFCSNICSYCDFCKFYYNTDLADNYLNQLLQEIKTNYRNDIINTIYIGGGTPSCLTVSQLKKLFSFFDMINVSDKLEYTIECNINDITEEKLLLFKENHINRISVGVQSFQEKILDYLDRSSYKDEIINKINLVKKYFKNINIDLIYAVPFETIDMLKDDLDVLLGLDIPHISTYSLIIEDHTKLGINKVKNISDDLDRSMYDLISDILNKNKYIHYETSNFCKPGYESPHNLTYWNNNRYYGFGLGASGYIGNVRYTNTRNIKKYLSGNFISEKEIMNVKTDASNYAILSLRTKYGVNKEKFRNLYGSDFVSWFVVNDLIDNNILIDNGNSYVINYNYWYVANEILSRFI